MSLGGLLCVLFNDMASKQQTNKYFQNKSTDVKEADVQHSGATETFSSPSAELVCTKWEGQTWNMFACVCVLRVWLQG